MQKVKLSDLIYLSINIPIVSFLRFYLKQIIPTYSWRWNFKEFCVTRMIYSQKMSISINILSWVTVYVSVARKYKYHAWHLLEMLQADKYEQIGNYAELSSLVNSWSFSKSSKQANHIMKLLNIGRFVSKSMLVPRWVDRRWIFHVVKRGAKWLMSKSRKKFDCASKSFQ